MTRFQYDENYAYQDHTILLKSNPEYKSQYDLQAKHFILAIKEHYRILKEMNQ